ncbi:hypothetical protein evm_014906 [Chilo suppressalis]|nr:hypothetical protein evm_014906 [Chilo suppressalis]
MADFCVSLFSDSARYCSLCLANVGTATAAIDFVDSREKKAALAEFLAGSPQYKVSRRSFANRWRSFLTFTSLVRTRLVDAARPHTRPCAAAIRALALAHTLATTTTEPPGGRAQGQGQGQGQGEGDATRRRRASDTAHPVYHT